MTDHSTKRTILMVTTFTISPLFTTFIVALTVAAFTSQAYDFVEALAMALKFSIFGLALYFLPATLIGVIFNKQVMRQDKGAFAKILQMTAIGFIISALWAMLFGYFYVEDINTELYTYFNIVLVLGFIGAISCTAVTTMVLKFLVAPEYKL